jgi:hypothetical protein
MRLCVFSASLDNKESHTQDRDSTNGSCRNDDTARSITVVASTPTILVQESFYLASSQSRPVLRNVLIFYKLAKLMKERRSIVLLVKLAVRTEH